MGTGVSSKNESAKRAIQRCGVNRNSSPAEIVDRLDKYRDKYDIGDGDQLWACFDKDHWAESNHIQNLRQDFLQLCRQKDYFVAMSHPCFELWLLLHFEEPTEGHEVACAKRKTKACRFLASVTTKQIVRHFLLHMQWSLPAIERAKTSDVSPDEIPERPATRVYKILEELARRGAIDIVGS